MLIVEFAIEPLDKSTSIADPVAKTVDIIAKSGLDYEVGPMATAIEGEWQPVMDVVEKCLKELRKESDRVMFSIRGDLRSGKESRIKKNVDRVEENLARDAQL